ncbi:Aldo/keto reductase [Annulohypoxylon maeteangense]|uniref:Aldo/keto reductase n=1 Tax=Annulohypoxylon maeteangense TaxID=1927788 RepID=UPI002007ABE5|nr:Aldo/keto reductase [Annulohypoxylon maeteangense]KAI0889740.1 Aldo/keto reductase [Annulohypoxylon maeteangense]
MALLQIISAMAMAIAAPLFLGQPLFTLPVAAQAQWSRVHEIPGFGLGTWRSNGDQAAHAVEYALSLGYDHIDAAHIYRNEDETGKGIADANVDRRYIWVTSKLWNTDHQPDRVEPAIRQSLSDLGLDYLDLYLMHWPVAFVPGDGTELDRETSIVDTWRAMEDLVRANLTRFIGISNFSRRNLNVILDICDICPYAHEFELHPYLQQNDFVNFHKEVGIKVIAYSPLGNTNPIYNGRHGNLPPLLEDPFWKKLADVKGASVAQTVLAWGMRRGTVVIPKSVHENHIYQNMFSLEINFNVLEMYNISQQDKRARMNNPSESWGVELFADLDDHTSLDGNKGQEL